MPSPPEGARCLVFDLGAGSGRAMLAEIADGAVALTELHRFSGYETRLPDGPAWDVEAVFAGIGEGLARAAEAGGVDSIGVDSWGVDFGLLDEDGFLVDQPRTYRHPRGAEGFDALRPFHDDLARRSGVQVLPITTLFHLHRWCRTRGRDAERVRHFLMIADLVAFHLSGVAACERTLARTSGLLNVESGDWDERLLALTGLPRDAFPPVVSAGRRLGVLRADLAARSGLGGVPVVATGAHDTASAVTALALEPDDAFLICGSWTLLGVETPDGDVPEAAQASGFGLEGGIEGSGLLVRSLPGLHLLRRLREAWTSATGDDVDFVELAERAAASPAERPIRVSDPAFFDPVDMIGAIRAFDPAIDTRDPGAMARAVYLGLAAEIADGLALIDGFRERPIRRIRMGGGGCRDRLLRELVAKACGCPVVAGPVEASAMGNALIQFVAQGRFGSTRAARDHLVAGASVRPDATR